MTRKSGSSNSRVDVPAEMFEAMEKEIKTRGDLIAGLMDIIMSQACRWPTYTARGFVDCRALGRSKQCDNCAAKNAALALQNK